MSDEEKMAKMMLEHVVDAAWQVGPHVFGEWIDIIGTWDADSPDFRLIKMFALAGVGAVLDGIMLRIDLRDGNATITPMLNPSVN